MKEQIFVETQMLWVVGQVFQPWKVKMFWHISPHAEGDGDWSWNTGGTARPQLQLPVLPCSEMGEFRTRSMQAREQEEVLHSKPRLSNVFGVGGDGAAACTRSVSLEKLFSQLT